MKLYTTLLAATAAIGLAGTAQATTLTFDVTGLTNGGNLVGNYGDNVSATDTDVDGTGAAAAGSYGVGAEGATPDVVVNYLGAVPTIWGGLNQYGDLSNVYENEQDGDVLTGMVFVSEAVDQEVTLSSFDLGNYSSEIIVPKLEIFADMVLMFSLANFILPASSTNTHLDFDNLDITGSQVGIFIDLTGLGGSSDNVGLDNVVISQSTLTTPSTIPLPAGLPLMLAGLGAFGLVRRKR